MRILLFLTFILLQYGCASVEVAKEFTKVTESLKTSVKNMKKQGSETDDIQDINKEKNENFTIESIEKEKEIIQVERKKEKKVVKEQKKITKINFMGKELSQINSMLGKENLNRIDGNTRIVRFDEKSCRLFLFFNSKITDAKVTHYEIRDLNGGLVRSKEKIKVCYNNFNLS